MTWTWKWNTVCQAAAPHEFRRLTPSAPSARSARPATRFAVRAHAARSSSPTSSRSAAWARGTTSAWPRVAGAMSMNASVRSSSSTTVAGRSPATIRQNRARAGSGGPPATIRQNRQSAGSSSAMAREPTDRVRPAMAATRPVDEVVAELREAIEHLASFPRPSASDGERRAADWIAARLRREGCDAHVEEERAHGGYWWPLGLLSPAAGVAALSGRRAAAVAVGAAAAAAIADDITGGAQWFRRRMLPGRSTWNVVAQA